MCFIGVSTERPPGPGYKDKLTFVELAPTPPLPRSATLQRWREANPELATSLAVPKHFLAGSGRFLSSSDLDETATWICESAEAISARVTVLCTGPEFTPTARNKERFLALCGKVRQPERRIAWQAGGLWEADETRDLALRHDIIPVSDPLDAKLEGTVAYGRVRAVGSRIRISEGMLSEIQGQLEGTTGEVYLAFQAVRAYRLAAQLRAMLDAHTPDDM